MHVGFFFLLVLVGFFKPLILFTQLLLPRSKRYPSRVLRKPVLAEKMPGNCQSTMSNIISGSLLF